MSAKRKETLLSLVGGDSEDILITVTNDATPTPALIDLSAAVDATAGRKAIARFAVKRMPAFEGNDEALVFKRSYNPGEILFLAQSGGTLGQLKIYVDKPDTDVVSAGTFRWDLEITRQDFLRTAAGTIDVEVDSDIVTGHGTSFSLAKVGDVLQPLGSSNTQPVKVLEVVSNTSLRVEHAGFTTESGIAFELRRGKSKTVARGPFQVAQSVVSG